MKRIGIIYSFNTRKTSQAAKKIGNEFDKKNVQHVNAEDITEKEFLNYDFCILGIPTWFDGELPNYWDEFVPAIEDMDLKGKMYALYGNGDQKGYPENFVDGIGIMADLLEIRGGRLVGFTSAADYHFESSKALRKGKFTGLALDFENQGRQINQRIRSWVKQIKAEAGLL